MFRTCSCIVTQPICSKSLPGVDEVFQVISRKLVERRAEIERERLYGTMGDRGGAANGGVEAKGSGGQEGRCC